VRARAGTPPALPLLGRRARLHDRGGRAASSKVAAAGVPALARCAGLGSRLRTRGALGQVRQQCGAQVDMGAELLADP